MADNLQILGKTYTNVAGIKAIDTNGDTLTFVKGEGGGGITPSGTMTITENGTYDVTNYASADVNVGSETVYYSATTGQPYYANTVIPTADYAEMPIFKDCGELVSLQFESTRTSAVTGINRVIGNNAKLKNLVVNAIIDSQNNYLFGNDTALETVQLGGLGRACGDKLNGRTFHNCTQQGLTITVYVADNQALPLSNAPWGATNATIIYRSETTGEVLTV